MENMQPKRDILIEGFTARLHREAEVLSVEAGEDGTLVRARVEERELRAVQDLVVRTPRRSAGAEVG